MTKQQSSSPVMEMGKKEGAIHGPNYPSLEDSLPDGQYLTVEFFAESLRLRCIP
jgi:hypothetical protein